MVKDTIYVIFESLECASSCMSGSIGSETDVPRNER